MTEGEGESTPADGLKVAANKSHEITATLALKLGRFSQLVLCAHCYSNVKFIH